MDLLYFCCVLALSQMFMTLYRETPWTLIVINWISYQGQQLCVPLGDVMNPKQRLWVLWSLVVPKPMRPCCGGCLAHGWELIGGKKFWNGGLKFVRSTSKVCLLLRSNSPGHTAPVFSVGVTKHWSPASWGQSQSTMLDAFAGVAPYERCTPLPNNHPIITQWLQIYTVVCIAEPPNMEIGLVSNMVQP